MDYYWELCTFVTALLSEIPAHTFVGVCDLNEGRKKNHEFIAIGMRMRGRKVSEKDTYALEDV